MRMKSKLIQILLTFGLFLGIVAIGLSEAAMAQSPKIHVLFVWATKATDTREIVKTTRKNFVEAMAEIGIRRDDDRPPFIGSFYELSGEDAHPRTILEYCNRMARDAGENDALFVYILSHGCSVMLKSQANSNDRRYLVHGLSPVATGGTFKEQDITRIGISRSSIIKAMKSTNHRLNVLITDACSTINEQPADPEPGGDLLKYEKFRLTYLLLHARGTINWNSTNPLGGNMKEGELAIGNPEAGTIFSRAFIKVACNEIDSKSYGPSQFFNQLGSASVDIYKEEKQRLRREGSHGFLMLAKQDKETLTEFIDDGRVLRYWTEENKVSY